MNTNFKISGKIINKRTQKGIPNLRIEAWDKDLLIDDLLGSAFSGEDGSFSITFDERYYRELIFDRRPDIYFKVFKDDQLLGDTKNHILWNVKQNIEYIVIPVPEEVLPGSSSLNVCKISGRIVSDKGTAVEGVKVIAYDKGISGDVALGNAVTDKSGNYTIFYSKELLQGKTALDIELRVLNGDKNQEEIGRSPVRYNAGGSETLDVTVLLSNVARAPEYQRLLTDLRSIIGSKELKDLHEDDKTENITLLSNKSGWDARVVAMAAQADVLSSKTGIPAPHYYALFRSGAATDENSLNRLSLRYVEDILKKSAEDNIIADGSDIPETLKIHSAQSAEFLLKNPFGPAVSSLNSMLDLRLTDPQQTTFVETCQELAGDTAGFWSSLKAKGFNEDTIAALQLDGKLGYLTMQNVPLIKRLYEAYQIADPSDLVRAGLYKASAWKELIGDDVPKDITADEYAMGLANQLNLSYPTLTTAEMVNRNEINLGEQAPKKELYDFFSARHSQYTIGIHPVKTWEGFGQLSPETHAAAKLIERIYQMSPSNEAMFTLSRSDLTSAYQIVKYTREEFKQKYADQFVTPEEADLVYTKAHEIYSTVMNISALYLTYRAAPNVYAITGETTKKEYALTGSPTLEELFGNMNYCACDHCKSVLSPAAYLVDLLQFIDLKDIPHDKQNPIDGLLLRRPDIQHIQLTCENTNTVLPYIDLVNEILEHYVVNGNLNTFTGHDMGQDTKTADLLADPQYVQDIAYVKTKEKVYPYNLPFDQPLEALRLLFQVWDSSLEAALDVFNSKLSARKERLGLNQEEYQILTDSTFRKLPEYFGQPADATIDDLNDAVANGKTFCRTVDISYKDLVELLKTQFINPGINLVPKLERLGVGLDKIQSLYDGTLSDGAFEALLPADLVLADYGGSVTDWLKNNQAPIMGLITLTDVNPGSEECNFAEVQLRYALPDLTANKLAAISYHKLHRFIRLWKKVGWGMDTTDKIITAFSPMPSGDITEANIDAVFVTLLARVAGFMRLMERRSLSEKKIPEWLALWDATIDPAIRYEQLSKLLRKRLPDLIDLSAITGLDPLAADLATDAPSLEQYLDVAESLASASLKISDLNYLLRHKDESGALTPSEAVLLKNIKGLKDAVTAIEAELSIAPDNADFSYAKTKMALVYDTSVVDDFFELLTDGKTYEASLPMQEEALPKKLADADLSLGYDPFRKSLTYKGMLSTPAQDALRSAADGLTLGDVTDITLQADLDAFITSFKNALQVLHDAGEADLTDFAAAYPELKTVFDTVKALTDPAEQLRALVNSVLPELRARLKINALRQSLTAMVKCDPEITTALTEKAEVLHSAGDTNKEILQDFLGLEETTVFNSNTTYYFYLDAPATDNYIIYAGAPENTIVTLTMAGQDVIDAKTIGTSEEVQNDVAVLLQAGSLCSVELTISGLPADTAVELSWQTKGMAKTAIPNAKIYQKETVDKAKTSFIRLQKSAQLQRLLKLTARELSYFAADNSETKNILNELNTDDSITDADLHSLWDKLYPLLYFTELKNENEPEQDTWVQIVEKPDVKTPQNDSLLLGVNSWKEADLNEVLAHMTLTLNDLSKLSNLKTVKRAMDLVGTLDHPAAKVISWATDSPTSPLIDAIKARIRERTDDAAWLNTMQTVSDPLRNKRRDALTTYILYHQKPSVEVDTADKLYEHFLIDVQMDACMKTSRIKQALSSVQLFIQRCLMNLEPDVAPSSIRAQQWEWMKRYRVWEANRKVFLYPENWLEPELRDNKSAFFTELEGELLQADITDDLAEKALLNYLKKLDDVARLEIAGMYLQENEQGNQDDDILHVFGRTNGNTRQYYYRRYEYGYWTPWEKISITIEGDLVFPIIWKSRLFIFWLNTVEKPAPAQTAKPDGTDVTFDDMRTTTWKDNAKKNIEITMCWAEYYKGKWTSPKSSELSQPMVIEGVQSFARNIITLCARKEKKDDKSSERLIFNLYYRNTGKNFIIIYTSKNSPPIIQTDQVDDQLYQNVRVFNYDLYLKEYESNSVYPRLNANSLEVPGKDLALIVDQPPLAENPAVTETVLVKSDLLFDGFRLLPIRHITENQWEAPFFYNDERSTFYVKPDEQYTPPIWAYEEYYYGGAVARPPDREIKIPLLQEAVVIPDIKNPVINPWNEVTKNVNPNYNRVLPTTQYFTFDKATFDAEGKMSGSL